MKRVLVAGLFHETHSFMDGRTGLDDFDIREGADLFTAAGDESPLDGVLQVAREEGWYVIPALDMRAMPGPVVADEVIEYFWDKLKRTAEFADTNDLDGVLIVMHGAMISESIDDVEGDLLSRIRTLIADRTPLGVVLDLHANVTSRMVSSVDAVVAYRENPHTDAKSSAVDAARILARLMSTQEKTQTRWEHPPILWPPTGTATADEPMRSLELLAREIERSRPEILAVNVFAGFAFADIREAGVSFTATTVGDPEIASAELLRLSDLALEKRLLGNTLDTPLHDALTKLSSHKSGPVILVEPGDNIGAGAPGAGTSLLQGLLEHGVENAAVIINDPEAVATLSGKSRGQVLALTFGGAGSSAYADPVELGVELLSTSDGKFELEDSQSHLASMCGTQIDMGPCAVVSHKGIRILLTSRKTPPFDLAQLRSQGIEPEELFVIGVKAAVAHRRAYDPIAKASYTVQTPGPCTSDLRSLPYRKVHRPIYPLDLSEGRQQ